MIQAGAQAARHYDDHDVWYRALWGDRLHHGLWQAGVRDAREASERLLRTVADAAGLAPGVRVCDVGCGYGGPARWFAGQTGAEVVAVTNSAKQAAFARAATTDPRISIVHADWLENDLPTGAFDVALALESLAHFADPARAVAEMARVVKPGGRLVVAGWMAGEVVPGWVERWVLGPIRRTGESPGLAGEAEHRCWFAAAGCGEIEVARFGGQVGRTWSVALAGAAKALLTDRLLLAEALRHPRRSLRLAASALRIRLAYHCGWLDYGVFTATR